MTLFIHKVQTSRHLHVMFHTVIFLQHNPAAQTRARMVARVSMKVQLTDATVHLVYGVEIRVTFVSIL